MRMNKMIRDYLDVHGLRHAYVADRAGIGQQKFSRMMTSKQKMSTEEFEMICIKGLHVSPAYFYRIIS